MPKLMAFSGILRQTIIDRANDHCEYCRISQFAQEAAFHIDHILPASAGGRTTLENLALACVSCSLRKAARETVVDPETGISTPIFNPRKHHWSEHFALDGVKMVGITPTGRGTAVALQMNRPHALDVRREEQMRGRFPVV